MHSHTLTHTPSENLLPVEHTPPFLSAGDHVRQRIELEVRRMGFDMQHAWRVSDINSNYKYGAHTQIHTHTHTLFIRQAFLC